MFVLARVASALFRALAAGLSACVQHRFQQNLTSACAPGREGAGCRADVRAIEIEPDALCELLDCLFTKTGICACNAGLGTIVASFDATYQFVVGAAANVRVSADDFLRVHGASSI